MHDNPIHLLIIHCTDRLSKSFRSPSITQVEAQQPSPYIAQSEYQSPFTYQIEGQQPVQPTQAQQPTQVQQPIIVQQVGLARFCSKSFTYSFTIYLLVSN